MAIKLKREEEKEKLKEELELISIAPWGLYVNEELLR